MFEIPDDWLEIAVRLGLAVFLSAIFGFDREVRNKSAGLRTHMLVGLGAAGVCIFAYGLIDEVGGNSESVRLDLLRVISGVIGGLGFLGGGAILQSKGEVHGMTTAAGIWIVGIIGLGCGVGNYYAVTVLTFIAVVCLIPIRLVEKKIEVRKSSAGRKLK